VNTSIVYQRAGSFVEEEHDPAAAAGAASSSSSSVGNGPAGSAGSAAPAISAISAVGGDAAAGRKGHITGDLDANEAATGPSCSAAASGADAVVDRVVSSGRAGRTGAAIECRLGRSSTASPSGSARRVTPGTAKLRPCAATAACSGSPTDETTD
jgi:hypothetical protein